jgi:molybdenum cofactor synthesis domain-containing protein
LRVPQDGHTNSPTPATSSSARQLPQRTIIAAEPTGDRREPNRILAAMEVAAVIVGDEVLAGHVTDANGAALADALRNAGHRLRRIGVVGDEVDVIAREVRLARADGCRLVITSGGIGPTHDDVTLEGVALGMGRELVECVAMRARIDGWIDRATSAGVSESALGASWLRRMALAPAGAELLECSIPVPAFAITDAEGTVCVLPGPPAQFSAALHDGVLPRFLDAPPERAIDEVAHVFPESMLAEVLAELAAAHPEITIGSYPQTGRTVVRVQGRPDGVSAAARSVRLAIVQLELSPDGQAVRGV